MRGRRNETPFFFVHIGKAGGGNIRARIAAAALGYNRSEWHLANQDPTYYYPMYDVHSGEMHRGILANQKMCHFTTPTQNLTSSSEGKIRTAYCFATTPLGRAIACPVYAPDVCSNGINDSRCDIVYMGHNHIGSELHWLPTNYLVQWWKSTKYYDPEHDFIAELLQNRLMS
jgi:hypothetical protein